MTRVRFFDQQSLGLEPPPAAIPDPPVYLCDFVLPSGVPCGTRACHGFNVKLRAGQRGTWFCDFHNPEKPHGSRHAVLPDARPPREAEVG